MRFVKAALGALLLAVAFVGLIWGGLSLYLSRQLQKRIVPDGTGALMALNADGLRQLNILYARPRACGDRDIRSRLESGEWWTLCMQPIQIPSAVGNGLVLLPPGTKAKSLKTQVVFADGTLADSEKFRNQAAETRAGAVEVERIELKGASRNNRTGWVPRGYLQCECGPFL